MLSVLSAPGFAAYLAGNIVSTMGTWGQRVVFLWLAWESTRSTAVLGYMAAAELFPALLFAPISGTLADRFDRVKLVVWAQIASILPALVAIMAVTMDMLTPALLIGLSLVIGALNGIEHPARLAVVGNIVAKDRVRSAVAVNSIGFNLGRMAGPALGGAAIAWGMPAAMFWVNVASYIFFAAVLWRLRRPVAGGTAASNRSATGWRTMLGALPSPVRHAIGYFAAVALCMRPLFELLPSFAQELAVREEEAASLFAALTSAQALGAALGSAAIGITFALVSASRAMVLAGGGIVASIAVFLAIPVPWVALVAVTILSGCVVANGVACQVLLQTSLPDDQRGKILSLYTMIFRGMPAMGTLVIGYLAEWWSQSAIFAVLAVVMGAYSILVGRIVWKG